MKKSYRFRWADTGLETLQELYEVEWFAVFLSGTYLGRPVEWFEPVQDPAKRVTVEENLYGSKSS